MSDAPSLLDELRVQYEAARQSQHGHADVPGFEEINGQLRKAFRSNWDRAVRLSRKKRSTKQDSGTQASMSRFATARKSA
ncbi:MAG TPA: hypothetical protein VGK44_00905 [Casimicrobiaceae bacterium]|jgi:hypothetical protein